MRTYVCVCMVSLSLYTLRCLVFTIQFSWDVFWFELFWSIPKSQLGKQLTPLTPCIWSEYSEHLHKACFVFPSNERSLPVAKCGRNSKQRRLGLSQVFKMFFWASGDFWWNNDLIYERITEFTYVYMGSYSFDWLNGIYKQPWWDIIVLIPFGNLTAANWTISMLKFVKLQALQADR